MPNQVTGISLNATVTGTGNYVVSAPEPGVGSVPTSNLTVGEKGWFIAKGGTGVDTKRESVELTLIQATPLTFSRGVVKNSTDADALINWPTNTSVVLRPDVPDGESVYRFGDGTFNLIAELALALGLEEFTENQTVTAGNVTNLANCRIPNARYRIEAFSETDPSDRLAAEVFTGPDDGNGDATGIDVTYEEYGSFSLEESGLLVNVRNTSGSSITFSKIIASKSA